MRREIWICHLIAVAVVGGWGTSAAPVTHGHLLTGMTQTCEREGGRLDYRTHYERGVGEIVQRERDLGQMARHGDSQTLAGAAATLVDAWQMGDRADTSLAAGAHARLEAIVSEWEAAARQGRNFTAHNPFFAYYPILHAYHGLEEAGRIEPEFRHRFRAFVAGFFRPLERGDHNRAICAATGLAMAIKLFPDLPQVPQWGRYIDAVWDDWYGHRDTTENAANYNGIVAVYLFQLAELTGRMNHMKDPAVCAMYGRWRDQVSPAGLIAGYGDGDEHANWAGFVAGFERAAAFYREPTFRWAAQRMFEGGSVARPLREGEGLRHLALAMQWADESMEPTRPDLGAVVLKRREPGNDGALDKLILAPDRRSGSPFALVDLYSRGGHFHPEWGSVELLEVEGSPMLHGMGYHNRSPAHANLLLMTPPGADFPHQTRPFRPQTWYEASMPTAELPPLPSDVDSSRRRIDTVVFRVETPDNVKLTIDNLRLVGPQGELSIDDFEQLRDWRGGRSLDLVNDAREGQRAMRAVVGGQRITFIERRDIGLTFNLDDYDEIRFDWKLSNDRQGWVRPLIFRVMGHGDPQAPFAGVAVHLPRMTARTVEARAANRNGDSWGAATFDNYFTRGTTLKRQYLLTREGVLVVRDDVNADQDADGWSAGPIWHLHHEPTRGDNWFSAPGSDRFNAGEKHLLVYFARDTEHDRDVPGERQRQIGVQPAELWGNYKPFTVYARQTLRVAQPATFITILIPHGPNASPEELAQNVKVRHGRLDTAIDIRLPDGMSRLHVRMGADETWEVQRDDQLERAQ